jgi:DNA-binding CsgD family transcriptional regulator
MTDSELAVVRLVADGLTNREVAERLDVSPRAVDGDLRRAFEKVDVNSRVALTRIATTPSDMRADQEGHGVAGTRLVSPSPPRLAEDAGRR